MQSPGGAACRDGNVQQEGAPSALLQYAECDPQIVWVAQSTHMHMHMSPVHWTVTRLGGS